MKKTPIIVISLIVIGLFITWLKLVNDFMGGSHVIKSYSYSGSVKEFKAHVQSFSMKDSDIVAESSSNLSADRKDYSFWLNITLKHHGQYILYQIKCENNYHLTSIGTSIELQMAIDTVNHIGGYDEEAKNFKPLIDSFEIYFIKPLENSQNIRIQ